VPTGIPANEENLPSTYSKYENKNLGYKIDFFHRLATGDRIVLWLSLLAVISKAATSDLIFILYHPFSRLDFMERVRISEFLKDNFGAGQLIIIDSKRDFESIKHV
jgi:hypothetical protein